jgi:general secretion pathway protein F/type IV pilus assembly protein PilC
MALIVTPRQLSRMGEFYEQLAGMLAAGVGLIQSLETILASPPHSSFVPRLAGVIGRLKQGYVLSESVNAAPGWIPTFDLALIQAGEQSVTLDNSFRVLATYYRERAQLARSALSDLLYPLFLLHLFVLVFPPGLLPRLVWQGEWQAFLWSKVSLLVPLYLVILAVVLASQGRWGRAVCVLQERVFRLVPMIGAARRSLALSRLASALRALLTAGVSIVSAWELAGVASGSPALGRAVQALLPRVANGERPGDLLETYPVFPPMFVSMYKTGELSGHIDATLQQLQNHYRDDATRKLKAAAEWLPRIAYLILLLVLAYFIVSFWMNYFGDALRGLGE